MHCNLFRAGAFLSQGAGIIAGVGGLATRFVAYIVAIATLLIPASAWAANATSPLIRLGQSVVPTHYTLDLTVDPERAEFTGRVEINVLMNAQVDHIVLHALGLQFDEIVLTANNAMLPATSKNLAEDGTVELGLPAPVGPGPATLTFVYHAKYGSGLEGLYRVQDSGQSAVFSQLEAIGARKVFPSFDEPGFKTPFDITVHAPKALQVVSNTLETNQWEEPNGLLAHQFARTAPLPTYLLAFAVGAFDIVTAPPIPPSNVRATAIPLRGIALRGQGKQLQFALSYTPKLVLAEEQYFGIAYPFDKFDIIAVPDFGAVGMENAGAIAYDDDLALLDEHSSLRRRREFLLTHAHEIAHQWFGNYATPKWWDDLWLNESFATLMEAKFADQIEPSWKFDTEVLGNAADAFALDRYASVRRVHEPVTTVDGITAAFDAITYNKGSALLAMVESALGPEQFRIFVHHYLQAHAFGVMDEISFMAALRKLPGGASVADMLVSFIDTRGIPLVRLQKREDGLLVTQSRYGGSTGQDLWTIPFCLSQLQASAILCQTLHASAVFVPGAEWSAGPALPVDNVARYFAFDLSENDWKLIFERLPQLSKPQALAVAINLDMSFVDHRVGLETYLLGVTALSQSPHWAVAEYPLDRMALLAAESQRCPGVANLMKAKIKDLYGARLASVPLTASLAGDDVDSWVQQLQREKLVSIFASSGADVEVQAELARLGEHIAATQSPAAEPGRDVPNDVASGALVAAAQVGGDDFLRAAVHRFKASDELSTRAMWLDAIASSRAPGATSAIEALVLSTDMRNQEVAQLLAARARFPQERNEAWDIVTRNSAALLRRLNGDSEIGLIQVADGFASEEQAEAVEKTITPLLGHLRGGSVQLQQTLEIIRHHAEVFHTLDAAAHCAATD